MVQLDNTYRRARSERQHCTCRSGECGRLLLAACSNSEGGSGSGQSAVACLNRRNDAYRAACFNACKEEDNTSQVRTAYNRNKFALDLGRSRQRSRQAVNCAGQTPVGDFEVTRRRRVDVGVHFLRLGSSNVITPIPPSKDLHPPASNLILPLPYSVRAARACLLFCLLMDIFLCLLLLRSTYLLPSAVPFPCHSLTTGLPFCSLPLPAYKVQGFSPLIREVCIYIY